MKKVAFIFFALLAVTGYMSGQTYLIDKIDSVAVSDYNSIRTFDLSGGKVYAQAFTVPVPTTDLLGYWDASQVGISTGDTIFLKNASNVTVAKIKIIGKDWTGNYIPLKTAATLQWVGTCTVDTNFWGANVKRSVYPTTVFQDIDYNHQTFFKKELHSLNADSTESLPARITVIAVYSTAKATTELTACNTYFNVPKYPATPRTIGVGKTYATPDLALTAASAGDTLLIFSGTYTGAYSTNKALTFQGVGNSALVTTSGTPLRCTAGNQVVKNLRIETTAATTIPFRTDGTSAQNIQVTNCYIKGTNNAFNNSTAGTDNLVIRNSVMLAPILFNGAYVNLIESYCATNITGNAVSAFGILRAYHSKFAQQTNYSVVPKDNTTYIRLLDCQATGLVIPDMALSNNFNISLEHSKFTSTNTQKSVGIFTAYTGTVNLTLDSCELIQNYYAGTSGTDYIFNYSAPGNFTLNKCYSDYLSKAFLYVDGKGNSNTFTMTDCNWNSNRSYSCNIKDMHFIALRNRFESDSVVNVLFRGETYTVGGQVNYNYVEHKTQQTGTSYLLKIGMSGSGGKTENVQILGNELIGCENYGVTPNTGTHGLWIHCADTIDCRYNTVQGAAIGLVIKNDGAALDSNLFAYNVIKDCSGQVVIRGAAETNFCNNTVATVSDTLGYSLWIDADPDFPTGYSINCKIQNNIFSSSNSYAERNLINFVEAQDTTGLIMSNNVFYNPTEDYFEIAGVSKTIANFTSFGFYEGSSNSNPNYNSNFNLWPTTPITGLNLGVPYNTGLNITTDWPTIVTKNQGATWQIGAYIQ